MGVYTVTRRDGAAGTITAARFETDGAGTRFYGDDGGIIAAFSDGQIASVHDADALSFTAPPVITTEESDQ